MQKLENNTATVLLYKHVQKASDVSTGIFSRGTNIYLYILRNWNTRVLKHQLQRLGLVAEVVKSTMKMTFPGYPQAA